MTGRADTAAWRVPSLPAECPPHPPSPSSRGHARPLAAGIAATALERQQRTSALQGDVCPLTWNGEHGGNRGQLRETGTERWAHAWHPRAQHRTLAPHAQHPGPAQAAQGPRPGWNQRELQAGAEAAKVAPAVPELGQEPPAAPLCPQRFPAPVPGPELPCVPQDLCCSFTALPEPLPPVVTPEPLNSVG